MNVTNMFLNGYLKKKYMCNNLLDLKSTSFPIMYKNWTKLYMGVESKLHELGMRGCQNSFLRIDSQEERLRGRALEIGDKQGKRPTHK